VAPETVPVAAAVPLGEAYPEEPAAPGTVRPEEAPVEEAARPLEVGQA
jgi:hypothetical protein